MADHEKAGLLAEVDDPSEDPLTQELQHEDENSDHDDETASSSMVELDDVTTNPAGERKKWKKKKVVRKKKKVQKRNEPLADGMDQAPVNPDELDSGEGQEGEYRSQAFDQTENIESHASIITQILVPVCITMALVITLVKVLNPPETLGSASTLYFENSADSGAKRFGGALLNALIFVGVMVGVTFIFVILYKYRCLKILFGWLGLSTIMLLGGGFGVLLWQLITTLNTNLDWISFAFLVWNFGAVGMVATFWHASVKVNQGYMIAVSVLMAVLFTRLPEWTTWTILAAIAIYDLFAVLCPRGPLRMLVETAQERNENIPALLYNTIITLMASTPTNGTNGVPPFGHDEDEDDGLVAAPSHVPLDLDGDEDHRYHENENGETNGEDINGQHEGDGRRVETFEIEEERSGVKLGLGDFIFYSVLVGRAALFDMLTVFTSFVGIITGLFGTILLLALWKKALPALPLSILFGVIFFFVSRFLLLPFATTLTAHSVIV